MMQNFKPQRHNANLMNMNSRPQHGGKMMNLNSKAHTGLSNLNTYVQPNVLGGVNVYNDDAKDEYLNAWDLPGYHAAGSYGGFYDLGAHQFDHVVVNPFEGMAAAPIATWGAPAAVNNHLFGTPYNAYGPWSSRVVEFDQ